MNKLPFMALLVLFSSQLQAEENPAPSKTATLKDLPGVKESAPTPEIKPSSLTKPSDFSPLAPEAVDRKPVYTKEQLEAINKEKNWAVEGLKDRREAERMELEKKELNEQSTLNALLEKERESIDERMVKSSSSMGQFKPSIENNWNTNTPGATGAEKELAEKQQQLQILSQMQNGWTPGGLDATADSPQAFDSTMTNSPGTANNASQGNSLQSLQNQLNGTKNKTESNFDHLVSTGQAQNFRKLSNDPNFQPPSIGTLSSQPSIDAVPSVPKPVTSTMSVETMRQIELQRVNAIPKPDFKELNSRIPDPGTRRF